MKPMMAPGLLDVRPDDAFGYKQAVRSVVAAHQHDLVRSMQGAVALPQARRLQSLYRDGPKRGVDLALALLVLPAVVLVILLLALAIMLDGGQPFYSQTRLGRGGRSFRLWKLRTMVPDADARLRDHLSQDPAAQAEWDVTQKLKSDPRITRVGRVLRRTSLDELPQLWNVLRGDMSLVGPRPILPSQRSLYPGRAYFALRPGITGLWQVSKRNETSFAERASFDADYHRRLSFALDARVLLATVRAVLGATGH